MSTPEDAMDEARRAAAQEEPAAPPGPEAARLERDVAPDRPAYETLAEWARIEVGPELVYSTRRFGKPVTLVKRGLLRFLRQYTRELEARQTRFNLAVLARLRELEERTPPE